MKCAIMLTALLFSIYSFSFSNEIDNLKTTREMEEFLKKQDGRLDKFSIQSTQKFYEDDGSNKLAVSLGVKAWVKTDLNNDGLTDLLLLGKWHSIKHLIAVLSNRDADFQLHFLNKGPFDNLYFPIVDTLDNAIVLILHKGAEISKEKQGEIVRTDTLVFKFGAFIELNNTIENHSIKRIEFSTTMCYGRCPVFELLVADDKTAYYNAEMYNKITGEFRTTIDSSSYNLLIKLLNYIDFSRLKDEYSVRWTDDQSCTLMITYDNDKTKTIYDYGLVGTYSLRRVYEILFSLRENQKWK